MSLSEALFLGFILELFSVTLSDIFLTFNLSLLLLFKAQVSVLS